MLHAWLLLTSGLICSINGATVISSGCVWNLNTQLPFNEPIYLSVSGNKVNLLVPNSPKGLQLHRNEELLLLCPGRKNTISNTDKSQTTVRCAGGQDVFLDSKKISLDELYCTKNSVGDGFITDEKCGNGGHIVKLGYNSTLGWINLINSCYNDESASALYTEHTIYGAAMKGSSKQSQRPSFHSLGVPRGVNPAQAYSQKGQTRALSKILDADAVAQLIGGNSYLARGHLAPDADFLFGSWQFTTYFYVNTVPQWQQINAGNWKRLEALVRQTAENLGHNLKVYTGSYGVLSVPTASGDVPLYLAPGNRLPVPKWTYKIIQSEKTKRAVAFATLNNPFTENISRSEMLCDNICRKSNWYRSDWENFSKGYTICCNVGELIKRLGDIPIITTTGVLTGPLMN